MYALEWEEKFTRFNSALEQFDGEEVAGFGAWLGDDVNLIVEGCPAFDQWTWTIRVYTEDEYGEYSFSERYAFNPTWYETPSEALYSVAQSAPSDSPESAGGECARSENQTSSAREYGASRPGELDFAVKAM